MPIKQQVLALKCLTRTTVATNDDPYNYIGLIQACIVEQDKVVGTIEIASLAGHKHYKM